MKTRAKTTLISTLFVLFLVLCVVAGMSLFNGISTVSAQAATVEPTDLTFMLNDDIDKYNTTTGAGLRAFSTGLICRTNRKHS